MKTTNRRLVKFGLLAFALALTLLALRGVPSASADVSDLQTEKTCTPTVFRPNEWTVYQCLVHMKNTGDKPMDVWSEWAKASGVIPTYYFVLYQIDGQPLPIAPTTLKIGPNGPLQPGQSINVRLIILLKMPSEGVYDGEWPTKVDGEDVPGSAPMHYEAKADADAPPKDLTVTQVGYSKGTHAVFETTITNNSSTAVTDVRATEHYGPQAQFVARESTVSLADTSANLVRWDSKPLVPGESITVTTAYEPLEGECGDLQSGVLVEATVDGKAQMYGSSGGSVAVDCSPNGGAVLLPADAGLASAPSTGQGPSTDSTPLTLYLAPAVGGITLAGAATLLRRRVRR